MNLSVSFVKLRAIYPFVKHRHREAMISFNSWFALKLNSLQIKPVKET